MPPTQPLTCNICGDRPPNARALELVGGELICVDVLACLGRGIDTAIALGQKLRQLRLWEDLDVD